MKNTNTCTLIDAKEEIEYKLKKKKSMFILFYATWCGFSQRFLPIFEKYASDTSQQSYQMMVDEFPQLCEQYQIEVYPTIIFFENRTPVHLLDGGPGVGLTEQQNRELIRLCEPT